MIIDNKESRKWMDQLREIKTEEEMTLMRKAISITCEAQNELMKVLKPEMKEYQAEAVVEAVFKMNGAEYQVIHPLWEQLKIHVFCIILRTEKR